MPIGGVSTSAAVVIHSGIKEVYAFVFSEERYHIGYLEAYRRVCESFKP